VVYTLHFETEQVVFACSGVPLPVWCQGPLLDMDRDAPA